MIRKIFGFKDGKSLVNITLENIQNKMYEMGFNKGFVEEIMIILEKRFNKYGKREFQEWFNGLHYRIPEELKDELLAIKIYEKHALLIEEQVRIRKRNKIVLGITNRRIKEYK